MVGDCGLDCFPAKSFVLHSLEEGEATGCRGRAWTRTGRPFELQQRVYIRKDVFRRTPSLSLLLTLFQHTNTQSALSKSLVLQRTG